MSVPERAPQPEPEGRVVRLDLRLDPEGRSAAAARDFLSGLGEVVEPELLDDLRLIATELVTNSVLHARPRRGGWVEVRVEVSDGRARLEVSDPGRGFDPHRRPLSHGDGGESGWGLRIVDRLADRWGVATDAVTRVWAELDLPRTAGRAGSATA